MGRISKSKKATKAKTATSKQKGPIPVTLLSGFLGSGKTTLLEHILTASHGYKIAVIINDMSSLNIDASLIRNHKVHNTEEKLVQLQNGCICCTLRGDLLKGLTSLAKSQDVDYIVIESTGISEPMQVAETFTTEFTEALLQNDAGIPEEMVDKNTEKVLKEIIDIGGLTKLAYLDTCVTVIDSINFLENFETIEFLADRWGDNGQGEAERTITDLMVDQIEFCDVIILNKTSGISKKKIADIEKIVHQLNPVAKVYKTDYCKIDLKHILNTGLYDFEKATTSAGWLQSIKEMSIREGKFGDNQSSRLAPKPETEEYGINNFVYTARKPFHPQRLYDLVVNKFYVIEQTQLDDTKNSEDDDEDEDDEEEDDDEEDEEEEDEKTTIENKKNSAFGPLLRSKGDFWIASRYIVRGEWSHAGTMLTLKGGMPWFAVSREFWPEDPKAVEMILQDFQGAHGDRRQEIVMIGLSIDKEQITKALDSALLTDEEMERFDGIVKNANGLLDIEKKLNKAFEDPFEPWLMLENEEEEEEADEAVVESKIGTKTEEALEDESEKSSGEDDAPSETSKSEEIDDSESSGAKNEKENTIVKNIVHDIQHSLHHHGPGHNHSHSHNQTPQKLVAVSGKL
ncbi:uncharacterized protein OGAPODRAFT_90633 [Ogataea polymorpha]|uniref:uncharacterized protein n=1 Tax=Ogataea polymorpha TaxID=460523 RepID=UPI0007F379B5|nr:uncharacterized protein OGAPODRAFT_90633 [Ogataea polymorpha]OBA14608.1 hypothetical protein OGAPODRAFT_90633 [Ogataea polymorpha]